MGFFTKFKEKFFGGKKEVPKKSGGKTKYFYSKKLDPVYTRTLNRSIKANAAGKETAVKINYTKADGTVGERKIRPITAKKSKSGYTVFAHDYTRGAVRSFRVDRIGSIKTAASSCSPFAKKVNKLMKKKASPFWMGFAKEAGFMGLSKADREALKEVSENLKDLNKLKDVTVKIDPKSIQGLRSVVGDATKGGERVFGKTLQETAEKATSNIKALKSKNIVVPSLVAGFGLGLGAVLSRLLERKQKPVQFQMPAGYGGGIGSPPATRQPRRGY